MKSLVIEIRHENTIKQHQTEKEDKLALFLENMIINVENPQNKNVRISRCTKISRYKVIKHKLAAFLNASNKYLENEINENTI